MISLSCKGEEAPVMFAAWTSRECRGRGAKEDLQENGLEILRKGGGP